MKTKKISLEIALNVENVRDSSQRRNQGVICYFLLFMVVVVVVAAMGRYMSVSV